MKKKRHNWTDEQYKFLADNIKGRLRRKVYKMFNDNFKLELDDNAISNALRRKKLKSGVAKTCKKGHELRLMTLGSESLQNGQVIIKTEQPDVWVYKHHKIWEEKNGKIPKSHVVMFGDRDKKNFNIENLVLVSKSQFMGLNRENLIQTSAKLTKIALNIMELQSKIISVGKKGVRR